MKISFCCDHGGIVAKESVLNYLKANGHEVVDFGTYSDASCDYPDYAYPCAEAVANGECQRGILICGTGIGMSICANKVKGVRCAHVTDLFCAEVTRQHNNSNMIALGARINTVDEIVSFIDKFLKTDFDGGRHEIRVGKINAYENK